MPYYNHTELAYVNKIAADAGVTATDWPFKNVERLVDDTGERFFSEYLTTIKPHKQMYDTMDRCLCNTCKVHSPIPLIQPPSAVQQQLQQKLPAKLQVQRPMASTDGMGLQQTNQNLNGQQLTTPVTPMQQPPPTASVQQREALSDNHGGAVTNTSAMMPPFINQTQILPIMIPYPWPFPIGTHSFSSAPFVNMPSFCCGSYMTWYQQDNRMGRPPHDRRCHRRGSGTGKEK